MKNVRNWECYADLWYKDQCHGEIAAEDVGEGHEGEGRVRLVGDHHGDRGRDDAQH